MKIHPSLQPPLDMVLEAHEIDIKAAIEGLMSQDKYQRDNLETRKDHLRKTLKEILDGKRNLQDVWIDRLCKLVNMLLPDGKPDREKMRKVIQAIRDAKDESVVQHAPRRLMGVMDMVMNSGQKIDYARLKLLTKCFQQFIDQQEPDEADRDDDEDEEDDDEDEQDDDEQDDDDEEEQEDDDEQEEADEERQQEPAQQEVPKPVPKFMLSKRKRA